MEIIFKLFGTLGTIFLSFSGLPQAIQSYKEGHARGVNQGTVLLWTFGEIAMLAYTLYFYPTDLILLGNYFMNTILVGIICWYKYFGRNK